MFATHMDAERRYGALRARMLKLAQHSSVVDLGVPVTLRLIDSAALSAFKRWKHAPNRKVDWDWIDGYAAFKFRHPKRFELAVWEKNQLASLSLGRPTYNGTAIRLDFIEASPVRDSDTKLLPVTLLAMTAYADLLGARELRVLHPINTTVRHYYERHGLTYVAKGDYLYMGIRG